MLLIKLKYLVFLTIFFSITPVFCLTDSTNAVSIKDILCFKYSFKTGDTLIYKAVAYDSIIIDYGTPLFRTRNEIYKIICDSVSKKGTFYLNSELIDYSATENYGELKNLAVDNSPWLGRKAFFEIDSLGKRFSYSHDDSTKFAITPGGPYNPFFIINLGSFCKAVNQTWSNSFTYDLPENAVPAPIVKQHNLFRLTGTTDTLNEKCTRIEYIVTAQGSYRTITDGMELRNTSIINGHGIIDISVEKKIPVHHFNTIEQKITMHYPNGDKVPGLHFIFVDYTLLSLTHANIIEPANDKPVNKKKKNKY